MSSSESEFNNSSDDSEPIETGMIKIVRIPIRHIDPITQIEKMGISFGPFQQYIIKSSQNLHISNNVMQIIAFAVSTRARTILRSAYIYHKNRLNTNYKGYKQLVSVPKVNLALLQAEYNIISGKRNFLNENSPDEDLKEFSKCTIERKKYQYLDKTQRYSTRHKFPPNILESLPKTDKNTFISQYDIIAALDHDKYTSKRQIQAARITVGLNAKQNE